VGDVSRRRYGQATAGPLCLFCTKRDFSLDLLDIFSEHSWLTKSTPQDTLYYKTVYGLFVYWGFGVVQCNIRYTFTIRNMWYSNPEQFKETMGHDRDGRWFPRVTKILDVKSKPALDMFFKEMGSYESAEEVKNKSAEEGTLIHEVVQKVAIGEKVEIPETIKASVHSFQEFAEERKIHFHPEYIESAVISERNRFTGTVDALATIGGKFGVLDIKTSTGFFREYNLQTAAYVLALQEEEMKQKLNLPKDIETRWILRINQQKACTICRATLREKGGRKKIRSGRKPENICADTEHEWGDMAGDIELKEFPYFFYDIKAFLAAKALWEWEHSYWLRQVGYLGK